MPPRLRPDAAEIVKALNDERLVRLFHFTSLEICRPSETWAGWRRKKCLPLAISGPVPARVGMRYPIASTSTMTTGTR